MDITIYDKLTGEILRTVTCPEHDVQHQCRENEAFEVGNFNQETQYFINGSVCSYTEQDLDLKRSVPFGYRWKMPEKTIEQVLSDEAIYNYNATVVRQKRDEMLRVVDSMNPMRWETLTAYQQQQWREYRQALLNIPQQEDFPFSVTYPTPPSFV